MVAAAESAKATFPGTNGRIAFYSDRDGNNAVFRMNPGGTISENLASSSTSDYDPAYSVDGKNIAFVSERDGNSEIYRITSAGRSLTGLTFNTANDVVPSWQPV